MISRYIILLLIPLFLFSKEIITVAIDYEYSPLTYKSFEGKPEGLLVDFWRLWSKKSGYEVEFKFYDWDSSIEAVKNGDVIFHSGLTPDDNWMVKSKKMYELKTSFYKVKSKKLPKKLRIGSIDNYLMELAQQNFPNAKVIKYKDYLPMVKDILDNKIDVFVDDEIAVDIFLLQKGVKSKFETLDNKIYSDINVITNQENKKYIDIFNRYLNKMTIDELATIEDNILGKGKGFYNEKKSYKKNPIFTISEQKWLDKKEPIVYVYDPDWAPFEWNNGVNIHTGIVADILKLISKKIDVTFKPVHTKTWAESVKLVENKKVDMYSAVLETADRQKYMNFTSRYIFKYFGGIVTRDEDKKTYNDLSKDLKGKVIGLTKGNAIGDYMKNKYPNLTYKYVDSTQDGFTKLRSNSIDLFVVNVVTARYFITNNGFQDIKIASKLDLSFGLKIAISKDKPKEIVSILNKTIGLIEQKEIEQIYSKWIKNGNELVLTDEEKKYLEKQQPIKYVYDSHREPFEYLNDLGTHSGIVADVLDLISKKSSIKFEAIKTKDWKEANQLMKENKADMFSFIIQNSDREKYLNFTDKILFKVPVVFLTKSNDDNLYENIKFDFKDKIIGIVEGRAIYKKLIKEYPSLHFVKLQNIEDGFKQLEDGRVDIISLNKSTAKYYIKLKGYNDVKIATSVDVYFNFKMALQKSLPPEAFSIINRSLNNITEQEINKIYNRYINVKVQNRTDWKLILELSAIIILIFLFIIWNNKKLKSMVNDKTAEIREQQKALEEFNLSLEKTVEDRTQALNNERNFVNSIISTSQDALIVIDKNSIVTTWNQSANKIFGYTKEEMIGKSIEKIIPNEYKKSHFMGISRVNNGGEKKLLGKGVVEITGVTKCGKIIDIDLSLNTFSTNKDIFYSANIRDITERKELANKIQEEKQFIQIVLNSQEQIIVTTDGKQIKTANNSFLSFFHLKTLTEFKHKCICEKFENASSGYLSKYINGQIWIEYVINNPDKTHKVQISNEGTAYIFSVSASNLPIKDNLKIAVFTDITLLEQAKKEVEDINKHIGDSIEYASLIQGALIPDNKIFNDYFSDYFSIWNPKDIVGGDIYLFEALRNDDECLLMVIDCTGHGVPGAFVTMLVKAIERQIVSQIKHEDDEVSPAKILGIFNKTMKQLLKQEDINSISNAGFDGGIIYYNRMKKIIRFAGAETPLFYVVDNELKMIKGDRYSVGYKKCDKDYTYKEHTINVEKGMQFYITTDGYLDQNGGNKSFPFGKKRFKQIIEECHADENMSQQKDLFQKELLLYQSDNERNDDITLIGFKI